MTWLRGPPHHHPHDRSHGWLFPNLLHPSTLCHRLTPEEDWTASTACQAVSGLMSSLPGSLCLRTLTLRAALQLLSRKTHCLATPRVLSTSVIGSHPFEVEPEAAPTIALATNQRMSTYDQKVPGRGQQLSAFWSWDHLPLDEERSFPGSASGTLSKPNPQDPC